MADELIIAPGGEEAGEEVARLDKDIKKQDKKIREVKALKERTKTEPDFKANPDQVKKIKGLKKLQDDLNALKLQRDRAEKAAREGKALGATKEEKKKQYEEAMREKAEKEAKEAEEQKKEEEAAKEAAKDVQEEAEKPKVGRTGLVRMYREFDTIHKLRIDIGMGKIKKPTPAQLSRVKHLEVLQAKIAEEEKRVQEEEAKLGVPAEAEAAEEVTVQMIIDAEAEKKRAVEKDDLEEGIRLKKHVTDLRESYAKQLEAKKAAAIAADDLVAAQELKKEIEAVRGGKALAEEPQPPSEGEAEHEGAPSSAGAEAAEESAEVPKSPEAAPAEEEEAAPAEEEEAAPAEEEEPPAKSPEEKAAEPAEEPAAAPKEFQKVNWDDEDEDGGFDGMDPFAEDGAFAAAEAEAAEAAKEEAKRKAEEDARKAEEAANAPEEPEPEEEKPKEKPRPKTAEELGMKFHSAKPKNTGTQDEVVSSPLDGQTFEELVKSAKAKRETRPYTVAFNGTPQPERHVDPRPPRTGITTRAAAKRLMRDAKEYNESALYNTAAEPLGDDMFTWHVNVAPTEGTYAGSIVHFVIHFPDAYPLEAPSVRCCSKISHPTIIDTPRFTAEVCLAVTDGKSEPSKQNGMRGWKASYTLMTVLSHLSSMFDQTYLDEVAQVYQKQAGGAGRRQWEDALALDKVRVQEFECKATGHSLKTPSPPLPCYNGPFDDQVPYFPGDEEKPAGSLLEVKGGAVCARSDCKRAGHYWLHSFTGSGRHYFRAVLRGDKDDVEFGWRVGWSGNQGNCSDLGEDEDTWAIDAVSGALIHADEKQDGVSAKAGDVIDCFLDLDAGEISFSVNGTDIAAKFTGLDAKKEYHPAFCIAGGLSMELIFVTNSSVLPREKLPGQIASGKEEEEPCCYVTKEAMGEATLAMGINIERKGATITAISPEPGYIALDTFNSCNVKKASNGASISHALPVMLDSHHTAAARQLVERAIADMLRNPAATTLYKPPFKPVTTNKVAPLLFSGCVSFLSKDQSKKEAARPPAEFRWRGTLSMASHAVQLYKTLASSREQISADALSQLKTFSEKEDAEIRPSDAVAMTVVTTGQDEVKFDDVVNTAVRRVLVKGKKKSAAPGGALWEDVHHLAVSVVLCRLLAPLSAAEFASNVGAPPEGAASTFSAAVNSMWEAKTLPQLLLGAGIEGLSAEEINALIK